MIAPFRHPVTGHAPDACDWASNKPGHLQDLQELRLRTMRLFLIAEELDMH